MIVDYSCNWAGKCFDHVCYLEASRYLRESCIEFDNFMIAHQQNVLLGTVSLAVMMGLFLIFWIWLTKRLRWEESDDGASA